MRSFSIIAAVSSKRGIIGLKNTNTLPWHIPEDLQYFKALTYGKTVVMGRRTYESIGSKNLVGRRNVVISSQNLEGPDATYESLQKAFKYESPNLFVIGGARLYEEALQYSPKNIYLTVIDEDTANLTGDNFEYVTFPFINCEEVIGKEHVDIAFSKYTVFENSWDTSKSGIDFKTLELVACH